MGEHGEETIQHYALGTELVTYKIMIKLGVGLVISDKAERMLLCMYCIRTWLRTALAKGVLLPFFSVLAGFFRTSTSWSLPKMAPLLLLGSRSSTIARRAFRYFFILVGCSHGH